jgi:hypothetical protein
MRKRIVRAAREASPERGTWLDLERLATVEITSETGAQPIEAALVPGRGPGWRAAEPGEQLIRILFDRPLSLNRIHLEFEEHEQPRTQEFALRWSQDGGHSYEQILRQQYNFAPPDTSRQTEDYRVTLESVTALELRIVPDISGGDAFASLAQLRLA